MQWVVLLRAVCSREITGDLALRVKYAARLVVGVVEASAMRSRRLSMRADRSQVRCQELCASGVLFLLRQHVVHEISLTTTGRLLMM